MTLLPAAAREPYADRIVAEHGFLLELIEKAGSETRLQPILDWVVRRTTSLLGAEEGCLRLSVDTPHNTKTEHASRSERAGSWPGRVARAVSIEVCGRNELIATPDLTLDPRFPTLRGADSQVRALLAAPLETGGRVIGLLAVSDSRPGRVWTPQDRALLSAVAGRSAEIMGELQLHADADRLKRAIRLARVIQQTMIPSERLVVGRWQVKGRVLPAQVVGGDGFDYQICQGRIVLWILDVSGKGLPAALLMSNVQGSIRGICGTQQSVSEKVRFLNDLVTSSTCPAGSGRFVTFFGCEMDPGTGVLHYTNAGHNPPLLRRADASLEALTEGGLPLGVEAGSEYAEGEVQLGPGDALLVFSDGVTETFDASRDLYGEGRLKALWALEGHLDADIFLARAVDSIEAFRGRAPQSDDITLVVLGPLAE